MRNCIKLTNMGCVIRCIQVWIPTPSQGCVTLGKSGHLPEPGVPDWKTGLIPPPISCWKWSKPLAHCMTHSNYSPIQHYWWIRNVRVRILIVSLVTKSGLQTNPFWFSSSLAFVYPLSLFLSRSSYLIWILASQLRFPGPVSPLSSPAIIF